MSNRTNLYHPISIGKITFPGNVFLAPMAGYTDIPFRTLSIREGAGCTYTELVSAEGILRGNKNSHSLLRRSETEHFWGIQLFTSSPTNAARAVKLVTNLVPTIIDLNCGCPVPKVVQHGGGAALLKDPSLIYAIVKAMGDFTSIPLTVKIRSGWDSQSLNYLETADAAREGGASMVCLHPRTRAQGYNGTANWTHIDTLKKHLSIPVFGSGDLFTPMDVKHMLETTNCDGVMIARGAIGNPFIFRQIKTLLMEDTLHTIPLQERVETALLHLSLAIEVLGEPAACREMRKHLCSYIKGFHGAAALRNTIVHAETKAEYTRLLTQFLEIHPS